MNKRYKDLVDRENELLKKMKKLDLDDDFDRAVHKTYSDFVDNIRKLKVEYAVKVGKF